MSNDETAVVYVDLLGFSALTERNEIPHERLVEDMPRLYNRDLFERLRRHEPPVPGQPPIAGGELAAVFWLFHHTIEEARSARVVGDSPLTVLSFSDSVFLVTPAPADALQLSLHLIKEYIARRLPVRIGIGYGSFAPLRYMLDWAARQHTFTAQFVGKGLVRAHDAAESKAKGLRVLIHPSIEPHLALPHMAHFRRLALPDDEQSKKASLELNYLSGNTGSDKMISGAVLEMQASAPSEAQKHYTGTIKALERMTADLTGTTIGTTGP